MRSNSIDAIGSRPRRIATDIRFSAREDVVGGLDALGRSSVAGQPLGLLEAALEVAYRPDDAEVDAEVHERLGDLRDSR